MLSLCNTVSGPDVPVMYTNIHIAMWEINKRRTIPYQNRTLKYTVYFLCISMHCENMSVKVYMDVFIDVAE